MSDIFTSYDRAIERVLEQIGRANPYYSELLTYQQRLTQNIARSRRYGETGELKAERAEIIEQLNRISLSELNVGFNQIVQNQGKVPEIRMETQDLEQVGDRRIPQEGESETSTEQRAHSESPIPVTSAVGIFLCLLVGMVWFVVARDFESLFVVIEVIIAAISFLVWRAGINRHYDRYIAAALCLFVVVLLTPITFEQLNPPEIEPEFPKENLTPILPTEVIEIGDVKLGTITSASPDCFQFEFANRVTVEVLVETPSDFGYTLTVTDLAGAELGQASAAFGGNEALSFLAPEGEPVQICIAGYDSLSRGNYEIVLNLVSQSD